MARLTPSKSSIMKSPMPKSPMPKSPMVCEKYETGCMWQIYGLFNFRQGRSNKKLLSHRRHLNRLDDGNFKTKLDLLTKRDEKCQNIDDRMSNKTQAVDSDVESTRKLKGEEFSTELQMNRKIATDEVKHIQSNSEFVGHLPTDNGNTSKSRQKSPETKHRKPSNSVSVEKPLNKLNSAALPEVLGKELHRKNRRGCGCKSIDTVKHDQLKEISLMPVQMNAAEAIINQEFVDGVNHQSKQLSDALEILNSNKELFLKLLEDPNSLLVKHMEDLRESQSKSLCEANISDYSSSKAKQSEGPSGIHKLKSCDIHLSQESGKSEFSERIIVLKPGPSSMQISADRINTSLQSYSTLRNDEQNQMPAKFSFRRMKRKLRHAIGVGRKEQHSESIDVTIHKSPCHGTEDDCKGKGVGINRRNSPSTTHVDSEGVTKSSFDIKKRENVGKVKEHESRFGCEATSTSGSGLGNSNISLLSQPKRKESRISVEARKHLSELLNNGNKDKNYFERQAQKTWRSLTSFPEFDFVPTCSPVKDWENRFGNEQMRFSPYSYCQLVYENESRLQKNKKSCYSSPLSQDVEALTDNKKLNDRLQVFNSQPNISGCFQIVENNNTVHRGETNSLKVPSESESTDKIGTVEANYTILPGETNSVEALSKQYCTEKTNTRETNDTTYQGETVPSEKSSRLPLTSSPDVFPSAPSIQRVEDSDSIEDRGEQPSPVSVLEQFLVDATSPASTISEPAEEHHSPPIARSPLDPETSSLNEREFISEYVRAVLQGSSLNWDELSMVRHSSDQLLDPVLFEAVKFQVDQFHGDCMLLFDCINEVLVEVYHAYLPCSPWVSFIKPNVPRQLSIEKTVIHEVMKYADWHLSPHPSPRTLPKIVEKDIAQSRMWLDIRNDSEEVVFEMVEDVLEELIMETIC